MIQQWLKFLVLLLVMPSIKNVYAHDFELNGIYYKITSATDKTVAVTYKGRYSTEYSNEYAGSVIIPETICYSNTTYSVTSIDYSAFENCSNLLSVNIPNSITKIEDWAFMRTGLNEITIPNSMIEIGLKAFQDCKNLSLVNFNATHCTIMGSLDSEVFKGCAVTTVNIGENVEIIPDHAFSHCTGLWDIYIPISVTSIGERSFYYCDKLTNVTIPEFVNSIGRYAFYGCSNLTNVNFNAVRCATMGESFRGAFEYSGTTTLNIGEKVKLIPDNAFYGCSKLKSVIIPDSVIYMGENCFYQCSSLSDVAIGDGVQELGNRAFSRCSKLNSLVLGANIRNIGLEAFSSCSSMSKLYSRASKPPKCGLNALDDINKWYCELIIPENSLSAYQAAEQWKEFFYITEEAGIENIAVDESAELSVNVDGDEIIVNNAENYPVAIYTLAGHKVYYNHAYNGESISLSKGIYIVKAGSKTQKVII